MILENRLLEQIIKQNLCMLFSEDMFKIKIQPGEYNGSIMIQIHQSDVHDIILSATLELKISERRKTMHVVSTQFYCEDMDETFQDFVKCCKEIKAKIEQLSIYKTIYHEMEDGLVVNFNEIGIEGTRDLMRRDLFVKRSNDISYVKFDENGNIDTVVLDESQFRGMLNSFLADESVYVDFGSALIIQFADYDKYVGEDED